MLVNVRSVEIAEYLTLFLLLSYEFFPCNNSIPAFLANYAFGWGFNVSRGCYFARLVNIICESDCLV